MAQKRIVQLTETTAPVLADLLELETASPSNSRAVELVNLLFRAPDVVASADHTFADRYDARVAIITTGAGDRSAKLPNSGVDDLEAGDIFEVHKADSGAGKITVDRQGTDTIDGATSVPLYSLGDHARVMYLGSGSYTVLDLKSHGSNSNGEWRYYADGSGRFTRKVELSGIAITTASGNIFISAAQTAPSFPQTAVSVEAVTMRVEIANAAEWCVTSGLLPSLSAWGNYRVADSLSTASASPTLYCSADIRWRT